MVPLRNGVSGGRMTGQLAMRWQLAVLGAGAGGLLWLVADASDRAALGETLTLVLIVAIGSFCAAALAMTGPLRLLRAVPRAAGLAAVVAGLASLVSLRYGSPIGAEVPAQTLLALVTVASLPVPFLIAQAQGAWRDPAVLFQEAWSILVRFGAAWAFVGVSWLVILLSDQVLQIVGIEVISDIMRHTVLPMMLTGALLGLGMAVVHELSEYLSPALVLRLLRLLLPAVLGVVAVFLVALPFRGLSGLFSGFSPSLLLLSMVGVGVTLVSVAVDRTDADATQSPVIRRAAQGMALILPVMAGLAVWGIGQRIGAYGWTPDRVFVALVAGLGLVYGALYAGAVLRGAGWMARIRAGNVMLALAIVALAALWLTPVLNAERLSARSMLARLESGATLPKDLDLAALARWGKPGAEVMAILTERAKAPDQAALAAALEAAKAPPDPTAPDPQAAKALMAAMPVSPPTATATRDILLAAAPEYLMQDWTDACARRLAEGPPACLMIVADLLPALPGEEAILFIERSVGFTDLLGLYLAPDGSLGTQSVRQVNGKPLNGDEVSILFRAWLQVPPPLTPALVNQLGTGDSGLVILP
jgi:Domain of unknown function (DUF4153)